MVRNNCYKTIKERVLKSATDRNGYLTVCLCDNGTQKTRTIHQLVAISFLSHNPDGFNVVVDHKNTKTTDNRVDNLQLITQRENTSKNQNGGTSEYIGVSWHKGAKKWVAKIYINGRLKHLGLFTNELEASKAYQTALKQL